MTKPFISKEPFLDIALGSTCRKAVRIDASHQVPGVGQFFECPCAAGAPQNAEGENGTFAQKGGVCPGAPKTSFQKERVPIKRKELTANCLWYDTPASEWLAALPVGNGALGAMVPGNVCEETLFLNDDTLWAGYPREENNPSSLPALPKIRELIFSGQYGKAQKLVNKALLGSHSYTEPYEPMGELTLSFPTGSAVQNYRRILDMEQGIVTVEWEQNGIYYTLEVFSSAVDGVLVVHLTASQPGGLCCAVGAHSPLRHHVQTVGQQRLFVHGKAPSHIHVGNLSTFDKDITVEYSEDEAKGMPFVFGVEVLTQGGCCTAQANGLCVERADTVTFLVASATRYQEKEPLSAVEAQLKHAAALAYPVLVSRHVQDFSALFNRTRLTFALQEFQLAVPTDRLLKGVQDGDFSTLLVAQMFTYGRYLLLSSSRPGTQAANLQGIWNKDVTPPWWANYTNNINLEMNYWPAKVCGLAECEEPLFDFIKRLQQNGRQTAQKNYGCRGWTAHHQTDLWAFTHPVGEVSDTYPCCARWAMWPMAPAWLCRHLWEHYEFTLDVDFLRQRAWPAMREAALFVLDWLVEAPDGTLVTCPSTSPENTFFLPDGTEMDVSYGSTMDLSLARDLFQNCLSAGAALGLDDPLLQEIEAAQKRLCPIPVGKHGIREWALDYEETDPGHRHISPLYGLFPGDAISPQKDPALAQAAQKSLMHRIAHGGGSTGWSCAWIICCWARLQNAAHAGEWVNRFLSKFTYRNLFGYHPPRFFQIDGNFGFTAGVAEMLLQSEIGTLRLLPALPPDWPDGEVTGLCARGACRVHIRWKSGRLERAVIVSEIAQDLRVFYGAQSLCLSVKAREETAVYGQSFDGEILFPSIFSD